MARLTDFGDRSAPIGIEGVKAYCDEMNARHPDAPYVWMIGTRTNADGQSVRFVNPVRKSELRNRAPHVSALRMAADGERGGAKQIGQVKALEAHRG